jgi:hypothetical protein
MYAKLGVDKMQRFLSVYQIDKLLIKYVNLVRKDKKRRKELVRCNKRLHKMDGALKEAQKDIAGYMSLYFQLAGSHSVQTCLRFSAIAESISYNSVHHPEKLARDIGILTQIRKEFESHVAK